MPKIQHTEQRHNFIKRGLEVRDYGNCIWFQAETCLERFLGNETFGFRYPLGPSSSYRPDRPIFSRGNERSIITSVYNRIALDASSIAIQHARLDEDGRFTEVIDSSLNSCLSLEANLDQTGRAFIQDVVMSMLDEGCVAIVPTDTDIDPENGSYKIEKLRVGKVLEWYPQHVKLRVYNEQRGESRTSSCPRAQWPWWRTRSSQS